MLINPPIPIAQSQNLPRKPEKGPHRAQINLNSRRKKHIPQIRIELDQMLTQAFHELKMQPKKNNRIGTYDFYVLDNNVLRDYVAAVYDQYGIDDPLAQTTNSSVSLSLKDKDKDKKYSNPNVQKVKLYQTPQKIQSSQNNHGSSSNSKIGHRATRTTQRLSKLKKNFQSQLQTMPTAVIQDDQKSTQKKLKIDDVLSSKQGTYKRTHIKLNRRPSEQLLDMQQNPQSRINKMQQYQPSLQSQVKSHTQSQAQPRGQSYLLTKTKHKYCLMCQQPLDSDLITSHEAQCQPLQKLLNTPNLKVQQITQILTNKISVLQQKLAFYQSNIQQDVHTIRKIISQVLSSTSTTTTTINQSTSQSNHPSNSNKNNTNNNNSSNNYLNTEHEDQNNNNSNSNTLLESFSILSTIKCMELLDKLQWFRRMKGKSQTKNYSRIT